MFSVTRSRSRPKTGQFRNPGISMGKSGAITLIFRGLHGSKRAQPQSHPQPLSFSLRPMANILDILTFLWILPSFQIFFFLQYCHNWFLQKIVMNKFTKISKLWFLFNLNLFCWFFNVQLILFFLLQFLSLRWIRIQGIKICLPTQISLDPQHFYLSICWLEVNFF